MTQVIPRIEGSPGQSVSHIIPKGAALATSGLSLGWGTAILGGLALTSYLLDRKPPRGETIDPNITEIKGSSVIRQRLALGRSFLAGQEVYANAKESQDGRYAFLDRVLVLQSGACEAIEGVWIDGQRAAIQRVPAVFNSEAGRADPGYRIHTERDSRFTFRVVLWEYFSATGKQGGSLRTAYPDDWTDVPRLTGFSFVHVRIVQDREGPEENLWSNAPEFQFLVKGNKATWPGQEVPTWTENAAHLRYYYRSLALGETADRVDRASFDQAATYCGELITQDATISDALTCDLTDGRLFRQTTPAGAEFAPGASIDRISLDGPRLDVEASGPIDSSIAHWLRNNRIRIQLTIPFDTPNGDTVSIEADSMLRETLSVEPSGEAFTVASFILTDVQRDILERVAQDDQVTMRLIPVAPRYSINGIVEYQDNPDSVEKEMDFCWQGWVIDHNRKSYYEAGQPAPPVELEVGGEGMKIVEAGEVYTSPDLSDRINAVSVRAGSSAQKDWKEDTVTVDSADALAQDDGVPLRRQLPSTSLVSDNATLGRLSTIALKQLRIFRGGSYRVEPGDSVSAMSIRPGLYVLLTDPVQGIERERFRITRTRIEADKSVSMFLREDPDDLYSETRARFKTLDQPGVDLSVPPPQLAIDNITDHSIDVTGVGSRYVLVDLEWGPVADDGTYTRIGSAIAIHYYLLPFTIGNLRADQTYRIFARWRTAQGQVGRPAQADAKTDKQAAPPAIPNAWSIPALTSAILFWPGVPESFRPFLKHTFVEWGTVGEDDSFTQIGTVDEPNNAYRIDGLVPSTSYRARLAYVNTDDVKGELFVHDFTTLSPIDTTAVGIYFGEPAASASFAEGSAVSLQLPEAQGAANISYVLEGALPSGLNFISGTHRVTGNVAQGASGFYQVILRATNDDDATQTAAIPINITVSVSALGDPGPIRNLAIVPDETAEDRLGLTWLVPDMGGPFDGYEIQYREIE